MVAILLWQMTGKEPSQTTGRRPFEALGQKERLRELRNGNLIDDETKRQFDSLREIRRKYLHFLSQTHEDIAADARLAYRAALNVIRVALGVEFREGAVALRGDLAAYLAAKGLLTNR